tara:strand:- start:13650 stop:13904 length:255 start_codon:yes stop_codon:yes gene_type:complete
MDKEEIITQVASDILNNLKINQIINILKEDSVQKALSYYEGLSEEEQKELGEKITAARDEAIKQQEAAQAQKAPEELVDAEPAT